MSGEERRGAASDVRLDDAEARGVVEATLSALAAERPGLSLRVSTTWPFVADALRSTPPLAFGSVLPRGLRARARAWVAEWIEDRGVAR